jgi:diaminopimelate epimerase
MADMIKFTKMAASGNDFVVIDNRKQQAGSYKLPLLARQICRRKYGAGADGLLILEKSAGADIKMRIFNPDGSEPDMCGNGVRCIALYSARNQKSFDKLRTLRRRTLSKVEVPETRNQIKIMTKAGLIEAGVNKGKVRIKMRGPKAIKLDSALRLGKRQIRINSINTGVPHAVIFVEGLDKIDVVAIGRQIRFHKRFLPRGTNVDFVQVIDDNNISLRTYERGVEEETLACGTGTVAAALITACRLGLSGSRQINVYTKGGEILSVGFKLINAKFKDVWLEGRVRIVYRGVYNV